MSHHLTFGSGAHPYIVRGCHGDKGVEPPDYFKEVEDPMAAEFGFQTLYQLESVRNYLQANGMMVLKRVSYLPRRS